MASQAVIEAKKMVADLKLSAYIKIKVRDCGFTMRIVSKQMGHKPNFMYRKLKQGDFTGMELTQLSNILDLNLFEFYMRNVHETCRPTFIEKKLKTENEALKKQVEDLTKERDWLKEVVMRR